ncbi:hypothetical protein [Avibacterium paragallinarum]|nr:hypothetical protein [Avibacterium paragallinarum]MEE3608964.1 hypothetical protein [Avibacterium paragallinarum]MEE4384926.1 hypothetical protein [Avibacterium paragallinarum]WAL55991.1 hypothetical protein OY678_08300 [Avibacterium paragallinarum]WAM58530.1 hypothetical protein OW731_08135 [Avibacterium paragallinarum]
MSGENKALLASVSYIDIFDSEGNKKNTDDIKTELEKKRHLKES